MATKKPRAKKKVTVQATPAPKKPMTPAEIRPASYLDEPDLPIRKLAHWVQLDLQRANGMVGGRELAECIPRITFAIESLLSSAIESKIKLGVNLWVKVHETLRAKYANELAAINAVVDAHGTTEAAAAAGKNDDGGGSSADDLTMRIAQAMAIRRELEKK